MVRSLSLGATGRDVLAVQQSLNLRREPQDAVLLEDARFGPKTDAAVRLFQKRNSLPATGIVGPLSRAAMFRRPPQSRGLAPQRLDERHFSYSSR
jgi:peptidoglycan hydrolase-like protein with peptidoglycan-binding domain